MKSKAFSLTVCEWTSDLEIRDKSVNICVEEKKKLFAEYDQNTKRNIWFK